MILANALLWPIVIILWVLKIGAYGIGLLFIAGIFIEIHDGYYQRNPTAIRYKSFKHWITSWFHH